MLSESLTEYQGAGSEVPDVAKLVGEQRPLSSI